MQTGPTMSDPFAYHPKSFHIPWYNTPMIRRLTSLLLALVLLTGCTLPANLLETFGMAPTATQPPQPTASRTLPGAAPNPSTPSDPGASPSPMATRSSGPPVLTLWVPPEFDPDAGTLAGDLLHARLEEFSRLNNNVEVRVRVKSTSGPGGLLESLTASAAAAPLAMPSVVALPRTDLETAALKGLIYPLDGSSTVIDEQDWYDYARALAMVQGATFALPFAGDSLVIAYRPSRVVAAPADWETVYRLGQPMAFPAGDMQSLFVLSLYQSVGGIVEDAQRRPTLQPEVLSRVLQVIADGEQRGIFPYWLSQYETPAQVWQAYQDGRINALVTWSSAFLGTLPPDTAAVPIPALDDTPMSLATGWGWAIADPLPERRVLSIRLAEFLADGQFLARWTEAAGYMPTRPSSLAAWSNQSLKTLLSPIAVSAQARPSVDQLVGLGPVLKEATLKVMKRESDPTQAAQLAVPETR